MRNSARPPSRRPILTRILLAAWSLLLAGPAVSVDADPAWVTVSLGDTTLIRGNSLATPLPASRSLRVGDRVHTGADGRIELRFEDGMLMVLGPDSALHIQRYRQAIPKPESFFDLARGTLRTVTGLIGKKNPPGFQLRTPSAVLGVRGTDFTVTQQDCRRALCTRSTDASPELSVTVDSGSVVLTGKGGSIEVPAGQTAVLAGRTLAPRIRREPVAAPSPASPGQRPAVPVRKADNPSPSPDTQKPPESGGLNLVR